MKVAEQFPCEAKDLPTTSVFVALKEDVSYYNDGERLNYLSLEVIGDNVEQASAWVIKHEAGGYGGYTQRPYRIFKLIPTTVHRTISVAIHEQT